MPHDGLDYGNSKLHYIKGEFTACGRRIPGSVLRGCHVAEYGFRNPDNHYINCKRCLASIAKDRRTIQDK